MSEIADAPDAIARLRRFILDLAVRGKLVPQDPADEPASELLKRIAKEKAQLVKAGEIRTPKPIPGLSATPFPIPANWRWSQLAEIGVLSPRNEAPDDLESSFVPMPMIAAEYGVANEHEVRPWGEIKKGYTHFAEGDVGLAKITPCFENGKSTVFRHLDGRDRQRYDRVTHRAPAIRRSGLHPAVSQKPALHRNRHPEDDRHRWPEARADRVFRAFALSPPTARRTTPNRHQGR